MKRRPGTSLLKEGTAPGLIHRATHIGMAASILVRHHKRDLNAMTELTLQTPEVFKALDQPSRYKGAYGGRGSESWHFASMVLERCLLKPGSRIACIREIQKTLAQSAKLLIENKIQELGVGTEFRVLFDRIETPGGGLIIFLGMQDQNAESIKSLEGYDIAWVEEAQTLSARYWPYYARRLEQPAPKGRGGYRKCSAAAVLASCRAARRWLAVSAEGEAASAA